MYTRILHVYQLVMCDTYCDTVSYRDIFGSDMQYYYCTCI